MKKISLLLCITVVSVFCYRLGAQSEVMAWGNLTGIRVDGQLMEFESSLRVVEKGWNSLTATGKERQRPKYDREGDKQTVNTEIRGIKFTEIVEECGKGCALIRVNVSSEKDTIVEGVFLCFDLPGVLYSEANLHFTGGSGISKISKASISPLNNNKPLKVRSKGFIVESAKRKIEVVFGSTASVILRKENNDNSTQVYIELLGSKIRKGSKAQNTFSVKASGEIDNSLAEIVLHADRPGRKFDGLGGNFRLQNPKTDPPVIDYCLKNLRVAWGRVEMPWNFWHPDENVNPIEAAKAGKLNPRVDAAMKMAQRLTAVGIPVIISAWSAPNWAILGDPRDAFRLRSKGIYGYQLNPEKTEKIYRSIGDYAEYLKNFYGVEAVAFSFNESDLGINVRHTGEEHAEFIKGLGAHMASRELKTKLLLGDNSDATTFDFIIPAMNDPETHKYLLAVSFHSWRGCDDETLKKWAGAAQKLNLPLLVAEGSTDAAAWNYPEIFSEQTFAFYEINLYTRILAICQPLSILQWQLTADYSVLTGQGVFGTTGPLKPTQRFWNLKQLASTPEDAFAVPLSCNKNLVNCAAFGNLSRSEYAIHMVNNGAECKAIVRGIPEGVTSFNIYVTDKEKDMLKTGQAKVINGTVEFTLDAAAFVSLISTP
ncbi:MAG: hypothetical protein GYA41_05830 [Bacteroidales bacterium]|nr:hypothetical protein [Bacteroidales bacterium]